MNTGSGVQFGAEGPMMTGTWFNPSTGHKFTVRDCFFQDNQFMVQTMEGQVLDYNTIQNYIQCSDADGNATEPSPEMLTPKTEALPPEVADLVGGSMMTLEDEQAVRGLGNLHDLRHVAPASEHAYTQGYIQPVDPIDQDLAMVDRVLRRHPIPDFEASLVWDCPTKQIETLIEVLGIDPETIAKYYIEKLDKDAIFEGIKLRLAQYIGSQWGPKLTVSETATSEPQTKPRTPRTKNKKK